MVELLAVVDGVDRVDALAVQVRRERVDVAADHGHVEVAPALVRERSPGGDRLVRDVPQVSATVFGDDEHAHHAPTPFSRRTSARRPADSPASPSMISASDSLSGSYISVIVSALSTSAAVRPRSARSFAAISLRCACRIPRRLATAAR
ncbi:hypothetical protein BN903_15 [Halorubrum sp. AJ67]|nr:hypothetical protein BN903_15 [Halorubrum sp. AJ67]